MRTRFQKIVLGLCVITVCSLITITQIFGGVGPVISSWTWRNIFPSFRTEKISVQAEVPDVFNRSDLWRMQVSDKADQDFEENDIKDRFLFQRQWVINVSQSSYMRNIKKKKRILLTGNFDLAEEYYRAIPCAEPGVNFSQFCDIVQDNPQYPQYQNYEEFDAIVARRDWNTQFYEAPIQPQLLSFFSILESPYTLHEGDFRVNNPILASYWRGSDILAPYYKWIPFNNTETSTTGTKKNYATGKHKLAAIVVSHCPTYNDRLRYVHELQKFIPVDIYGLCGGLRYCGDDCFKKIRRDYKFYLSFENANCRDYITEKFFRNALSHDIVPIVLGAHPDDYVYASPPQSYIHVENFTSVQALANYLIYLDQNDDAYNSYFAWKGTGKIVDGHSDVLCKICSFLFYADFHPPTKVWPQDSAKWLRVNPCLAPSQHFWGSFRHY